MISLLGQLKHDCTQPQHAHMYYIFWILDFNHYCSLFYALWQIFYVQAYFQYMQKSCRIFLWIPLHCFVLNTFLFDSCIKKAIQYCIDGKETKIMEHTIPQATPPLWRDKRYRTWNYFLHQTFGETEHHVPQEVNPR